MNTLYYAYINELTIKKTTLCCFKQESQKSNTAFRNNRMTTPLQEIMLGADVGP